VNACEAKPNRPARAEAGEALVLELEPAAGPALGTLALLEDAGSSAKRPGVTAPVGIWAAAAAVAAATTAAAVAAGNCRAPSVRAASFGDA
jgi:hypothetical protein